MNNMARAKSMRVPREFEVFIDNLSEEFSRQTGLPKNNTATMRRMAVKFDGRMIVRGIDFDIALLGRSKRRN